MKIKNHYVWLCTVWIISALCNSVGSVVNFVDGNIIFGIALLIFSIAFGFVGGILFEKALTIYKHNQVCDWLHEIAEELREEASKKIKPFEEFDDE